MDCGATNPTTRQATDCEIPIQWITEYSAEELDQEKLVAEDTSCVLPVSFLLLFKTSFIFEGGLCRSCGRGRNLSSHFLEYAAFLGCEGNVIPLLLAGRLHDK